MPLPRSPVSVALSISASGGAILAALEFRNATAGTAHLYKVLACLEGRIENNLFEIDGPKGPVLYNGRYVKRREPAPADFLALAPGAELRATVDLAGSYMFDQGPGRYRAHYFAINPSRSDADTLEELVSNNVTFELDR